MLYIITNNNQLILGPMSWNRALFESTLEEDLSLRVRLPQTKTDSLPITIDSQTRILAVDYLPNPTYNPKIQGLNGPFFDYATDPTKAIARYEVMNYPVEAVQNMLKDVVARNRYLAEVSGIKVTIQGNELNINTARGARDIYAQALVVGSNGDRWKFSNDVWLTLSTAEVQTIAQAIKAHVQSVFNWEDQKVAEINSKTTLQDLDAIDLAYSGV
jgi:hypothetical protein